MEKGVNPNRYFIRDNAHSPPLLEVDLPTVAKMIDMGTLEFSFRKKRNTHLGMFTHRIYTRIDGVPHIRSQCTLPCCEYMFTKE